MKPVCIAYLNKEGGKGCVTRYLCVVLCLVLLRFRSLAAGSSRSVLTVFVCMVFVCDGIIYTSSICDSPSLGLSFEFILSSGVSLLPESLLHVPCWYVHTYRCVMSLRILNAKT